MLAAGPLASVQLFCRPTELGESPGWRGRAGAGSGGGRDSCRLDLLGALLARSLARTLAARSLERSLGPSGRREAECERKVRLQSPQMSHSWRVDLRFFFFSFFFLARNFKATIADTLAIPFPCHFNAGPLFGTFFPCFVSVCKYIDER